MKPLRCAIYARVSTDGQSTEMQLEQLRPYLAVRQWKPAGEYVDEGVSGTKTSRPRLDALMADVKRGQIDIVLVWKFDRMGRNTVHLVSVLDELRAHGVEFCSFTEQIDTSTPMGKCMFTIIAAMAELERANILMRSAAGLENAKRKGTVLGRPRAHDHITNERIREAYETMGSLRKVAILLNVPLTTVRARWQEIQKQVPTQEQEQPMEVTQ